MGRAVTYVTELLVGFACVGLAVVAWPRGGVLRIAAAAFAVAGAVAVGHAVLELAQ